MVYSASWDFSLVNYEDPTQMFFQQIRNMGIGLVVGVGCAFLHYHFWRKYSVYLMGAMLLALAAVLVYSSGMVWIKRIGDDSPPLAMTCGTLAVSLPLFLIAWFLMDGHVPSGVPQQSVAATLYLGVFGSVLGFALYFYLVKHMDTGRVALITLITPVMALLLGHALNNETILPQVWLGTASIVLGLGLHQWGGRRLKAI